MIETPVINPIIPGLPWEQEFTCDPLLTPIGTELRTLLREQGQTRTAPIARTLQPSMPAGLHKLTLTAAQTENLRAPGMLFGDFILYENGQPSRALFRGAFPVEAIDKP